MTKKMCSVVLCLALVAGLMASFPLSTRGAEPWDIGLTIKQGVAWLVEQQNEDGSWGQEFPVAKTALAVLKLEEHAVDEEHGPGLLDPLDPDFDYNKNLILGLDYLMLHAQETQLSQQTHGNPDTDGDGKGVYFVSPGWWTPIYETSIVLLALSASRHPDLYGDVVRDTVDYLGWAQTDMGDGRGGWCYEPVDNDGGWSDNSVSGWVTLGLASAESPEYRFRCAVPYFVRHELNKWIDYIQNDVDGDPDDGGSGYEIPGGANILRTGNLIQQMAFYGDEFHSQRVQDAINYIERHWYDENWEPGWRGAPGQPACYQATFTVMKGLETYGIDFFNEIDWFADIAAVLLAQQDDGSWPSSCWDETPGEQILSTEWALLTLQRVSPPPSPPPVVEKPPQPWYAGQIIEVFVISGLPDSASVDVYLGQEHVFSGPMDINRMEFVVPPLTEGLHPFEIIFEGLSVHFQEVEIIEVVVEKPPQPWSVGQTIEVFISGLPDSGFVEVFLGPEPVLAGPMDLDRVEFVVPELSSGEYPFTIFFEEQPVHFQEVEVSEAAEVFVEKPPQPWSVGQIIEVFVISGLPDFSHVDVNLGQGRVFTGPMDINRVEFIVPPLPDGLHPFEILFEGQPVHFQEVEIIAQPSEVWVDDDWVDANPGDPVDGHTFGLDAFAVIQDGVNAVASPGTVHVAAGYYPENVIISKNIDLAGAGAGLSIIDGGGTGRTVYYAAGAGTVHGFTITNSGMEGKLDADIYCLYSNVHIRNNLFVGNVWAGGGYNGVFCDHSSPTIENNVFTGKIYAVYAKYSSAPYVFNNLFLDNSSALVVDGVGLGVPASGIYVNNTICESRGRSVFIVNYASPVIKNNVIAGNNYGITVWGGFEALLLYNDVWGSRIEDYEGIPDQTGLNGNISQDPQFLYPAGGDYRLQAGSPCIDTGTNEDAPPQDRDGNPRPLDGNGDGSAITDMGAWEYVPPPNQPPDANANGPYSAPEGSPVTFDAGGSTDPDNDALQYRWDFDNDGIWDTVWSEDPITTCTWDDDYTGIVRLEVSDGALTDTASATVTVLNAAPAVDAGPQVTINEGGTFSGSGSFTDPGADTWTASVDYGDGSGPQPLLLAPDKTFVLSHTYADNSVYTVTVTVTDDDGGAGIDTIPVTVNNVAPQLEDVSITSPIEENDFTTLSGAIVDPGTLDTFTLSVDWGDGSPLETFSYLAGTATFSESHQYLDDNPTGTPSDIILVSMTIIDDDGGVGTDTIPVTVNNVAPQLADVSVTSPIEENDFTTLSGAIVDPGTLDTFTLSVDWGDGSPLETFSYLAGTATFSETHQYLDDNPTGTPSDIIPVSMTIVDDDGGQDQAWGYVTVHNVPPVPGGITATLDPVEAGTAITAGADFTDVGTQDTHTATWDWGDETTSSGTVTEANGSGSVTGEHIYNNAGVFTVKLTVADDDTGEDESVFQYIVVYDPGAGFVTGGGWIHSPEGAYAPESTLTGKANFGFVSKYKKGASTPTGQTQFQFKVANLNFHSSEYEWLVIAGAKAMYKGTGTINGEGEYRFILSAIDADINDNDAHTVDRFRIKIWDKATGEVIYDNQMGDAEDADAATEIGGGSIVIHKK